MQNMFFRKFRKHRERNQKLAHLLAGLVILINAYDRFDAGNMVYLVYLFAGLTFIAVAVFLPYILKKAPWANAVFFLIESFLSFVIAYEFFTAGKSALPYVYVVLGIAQLIIPLIKTRKQKNSPQGTEKLKNPFNGDSL